VAEGFADFRVVDEKDAGHALDVTDGTADKMTLAPGGERAIEAFEIEILAKLRADEAKGFVETSVRIAETGDVIEFVVGEEGFGFLLGAKMNEGKAGTGSFN